MRAVFYGDVCATVRALLVVQSDQRGAACKRIFKEADIADRFVRRLGKVHPHWGAGTLRDAAQNRALAPDPGFDDPDFLDCLSLVLDELRKRPRSPSL